MKSHVQDHTAIGGVESDLNPKLIKSLHPLHLHLLNCTASASVLDSDLLGIQISQPHCFLLQDTHVFPSVHFLSCHSAWDSMEPTRDPSGCG